LHFVFPILNSLGNIDTEGKNKIIIIIIHR